MTRPEEPNAVLQSHLAALHLPYMREHYHRLAEVAAAKHWSHLDYLSRLAEGEAQRREDRSIERRIRFARFPVRKSLEEFDWSWPKKINRLQVQNLFRLTFLDHHTNVIMLGGVGLGKTHLSIALGQSACLRGHSVLFTTAVDIINTLTAARAAGSLKGEMKRYLRPRVLIIDELGYLPIDKHGADLLSRSSVSAMSTAPSCSPPIGSTSTGPKSSTTTAR